MKTGHDEVLAAEKISSTAMRTLATMPPVPPDADTLAFFPGQHSRTHRIYYSRHLMARDAWIVESRPIAFFDKLVTMANPAGLHFNANGVGLGFWYWTVDDLKRSSWRSNLHGRHLCHQSLLG
jgi:hypothetical protein